ncbi:hypothetical protein BGZ73_007891 [Actinomortierella ambigua]|nr:hypothetical protein BGZ73_007891 [Actinomortierella ambigua]
MKLFTCIPEAGVIILLLVSLFVHGLTYLVTGGNVRRRMFEQRALPTSDDEYGVAVFKLGRACLEATRGIGFWNEVDAVVIPFGTILDKRQIRIATIPSTTGATDAPSSSPSTSTTEPNQRLWTSSFQHSSLFNPLVPSAGFSNEVPDVVDTPGHRQHISRRQSRLNSMRAFWQSTVLLLDGIYSAVYNKLAPARFPRRPRRIVIRPIATTMSTQEYLQLKMAIETAMEQAGRPASPDMQQEGHEGSALEGDLRMRRRWPHEAEDEERIYSRFLKESFSDENDEDYSDDEYIPPLDMEDEADSDVELGSQELQSSFGGQEALSEEQYDGLDVDGDSYEEEAEADENDEENAIVAQGSALGSLQDFLLDSSFLSIFLSGQGRDMPLTRSQHRRAIDNDARWDSDTTSDFEDHGRGSQRITGIRSRRTRTASHRRSNGDSSRQSLAQQENEGLLSLLQKYRKTSASLTAGSVNASAASSSSPMLAAEITSAQGPSTLSPPPMAEMPSNPEDSSLYPRLLCVVCQVEPRNILLRPCRCLALCNDCRELLAIRQLVN